MNERPVVITFRQRSCEKVMFSVVCLSDCLFTGGSRVAITNYALDLTVQGPQPSPPPRSRHGTALYWRPVQTCSLEDLPQPVLTSGGCSRKAGSAHPTRMLSSYCNHRHSDLYLDVIASYTSHGSHTMYIY